MTANRIYYFLFFLLLSPSAFAQTTSVSGTILQKGNNDPVMLNVFFTGDFRSATQADSLGRFSISTTKPVSFITIFGMSYDTIIIPVETGKVINDLVVYAEQSGIVGKEHIFKFNGDQGEKLIDSVLKHRKQTDFRRAESFFATSYEKTTLRLYNMLEKFRTKSLLSKPIRPIFSNPDTVDGIVMYPALISEMVADKYQKKGQMEAKHIKASQISGFTNDELGLTSLNSRLFSDFNIYDDYQKILGNQIIGPVNPIAKSYYTYKVMDTVNLNGHTCYQLQLIPKLFSETVYRGDLWISDTSFAVIKTDLYLDPNSNVDFIKSFRIKIEYERLKNDPTHFVIKTEELRLDVNPTDIIDIKFGFGKKIEGILISAIKNVKYKNYVLNESRPSYISFMGEVTEDKDIVKTEEWWEENRPDSLTTTEQRTYEIAKEISNSKIWNVIRKVGNFVGTGYANLDYLAIGPFYEIYSRNDIEGDRIKIGLKTGDSLSRRFIAEGSVAYGFGDKKWKWQGFASFHINKFRKPWKVIAIMGRQGIEQIGLNPGQFRPDNLIGTYLRRRSLKTLSYINQFQFVYDHDWTQSGNLKQKLTVDWQQVYPTSVLPFNLLNNGTISSSIPSYKRFEIRLETTFTPGKSTVGKGPFKLNIASSWPEFKLIYAIGIKGIWGSDYAYHLLRLNIKGRVPTPPLGHGEYSLSAGKIFGQVPYPLLEIHPGNDTYQYDPTAFNCMNYFEFISDQFISFSYEHHFEGLLFDKIPFFHKLGWQEIVGMRGVYGSLTEKNRNFMALPSGTHDLRDQLTGKYIPYLEFNVGIEKIMNLIRVDFVYRLTHRKQADPNNPGHLLNAESFNWGIFVSLRI
jgi:hypothetical protein